MQGVQGQGRGKGPDGFDAVLGVVGEVAQLRVGADAHAVVQAPKRPAHAVRLERTAGIVQPFHAIGAVRIAAAIAELAHGVGWPVPHDLRRHKGWSGELLEALGPDRHESLKERGRKAAETRKRREKGLGNLFQSHMLDASELPLKENIELGDVVQVVPAEGNVIDTYIHRQDGRGVLGVIVEVAGGSAELAHDVAVHIAFAKPGYLNRDEVPADEVAKERETLEGITRAEGKPEAALEKIVEGRLGGWFKDQVLLEQGYVKDEKQTIAQLLGGASIVRFALVAIG